MIAPITVQTTVEVPVDKVWEFWTTPAHITIWNQASPDWHTPMALNTLKEGGTFSYRMEAKDGSTGFDFEGTYTKVRNNENIAYKMTDGRRVSVDFVPTGEKTHIKQTFEPEKQNAKEVQQRGWQAILDNFKSYAEKADKKESKQ